MGKLRNRDDIEDRTMAYRDLRRLYKGTYTQDIDQLEYSFYGEEIVLVAILELTRVDYNPNFPNGPTPKYFEKILERFYYDNQARLAVEVAERLGIEAYIVAFDEPLDRFWVYNLSQKRGWKFFNRENYFAWIEGKHHAAILDRINAEKEILACSEN